METNVERIIREARETQEALETLGVKPRTFSLELNRQAQEVRWNTEVARRNGRLGGRPRKPSATPVLTSEEKQHAE